MLDRDLLGHRYDTFAAVLGRLRDVGRPVSIVETGCLREIDNWAGDGQSTRLFDWLTGDIGGRVISIDVDPQAIETARRIVSRRVLLVCDDGVGYLYRWITAAIDLLYLDSLDFDGNNPLVSATHHLFELTAAMPNLRAGSIVLVDDTSRPHGKWFGKGMLIAQYMERIGAPILVEGETQVAWTL